MTVDIYGSRTVVIPEGRASGQSRGRWYTQAIERKRGRNPQGSSSRCRNAIKNGRTIPYQINTQSTYLTNFTNLQETVTSDASQPTACLQIIPGVTAYLEQSVRCAQSRQIILHCPVICLWRESRALPLNLRVAHQR